LLPTNHALLLLFRFCPLCGEDPAALSLIGPKKMSRPMISRYCCSDVIRSVAETPAVLTLISQQEMSRPMISRYCCSDVIRSVAETPAALSLIGQQPPTKKQRMFGPGGLSLLDIYKARYMGFWYYFQTLSEQ
jgi:hypothetical protein